MRLLKVGLLACAGLWVGGVYAVPVTFSFAGSVDNDPFGVFDTASFTGSYTFDSNIPRVLNTPNSGGYAGTGGVYNMNVSFTGTLDSSMNGPYIANTLNITVNNNFPGPLDQYLVTGTSTTDSNLSIEITLQDFTGTAFSSTALPTSAPNLASFTSRRFALFDGTLDNPIEAEGNLTRLICTAGCGSGGGGGGTVPEPTTIALIAIAGLFGRAAHRRKTF